MYAPKRSCSEEEKNVKRYNGEGYHNLGMVTENQVSNAISNPLNEHYHVKGFNDSAEEKCTHTK